jgi:hypothetical protein
MHELEEDDEDEALPVNSCVGKLSIAWRSAGLVELPNLSERERKEERKRVMRYRPTRLGDIDISQTAYLSSSSS